MNRWIRIGNSDLNLIQDDQTGQYRVFVRSYRYVDLDGRLFYSEGTGIPHFATVEAAEEAAMLYLLNPTPGD